MVHGEGGPWIRYPVVVGAGAAILSRCG